MKESENRIGNNALVCLISALVNWKIRAILFYLVGILLPEVNILLWPILKAFPEFWFLIILLWIVEKYIYMFSQALIADETSYTYMTLMGEGNFDK